MKFRILGVKSYEKYLNGCMYTRATKKEKGFAPFTSQIHKGKSSNRIGREHTKSTQIPTERACLRSRSPSLSHLRVLGVSLRWKGSTRLFFRTLRTDYIHWQKKMEFFSRLIHPNLLSILSHGSSPSCTSASPLIRICSVSLSPFFLALLIFPSAPKEPMEFPLQIEKICYATDGS